MSRARGDAGDYLTPRAAVCQERREKGSRFLCLLHPVGAEEEVETLLASSRVRFADATHHCWAYRLGWPPRERSSDAGEPVGTAGVQMLKVLAGRGLSDTLAIVVRWFGGTKLGRGGLGRAYAGVLAQAVAAADLAARRRSTTLAIEMPYEQQGAVRHLLRSLGGEILDASYGRGIRLTVRVALADRGALEASLADRGLRAVPTARRLVRTGGITYT